MAYEDLGINAYKQLKNEDETTKRGILDRVLSPIMNTSVTSALYNITDNDPNTTFMGGIGAGISRQVNPFKDDVTDTHMASDVIKNVIGEPNNISGKLLTSVGGFVGDVVLDPMSYVSGGFSVGKRILEGSEKSVAKASLLKNGVKTPNAATIEDCANVIKKGHNASVQFDMLNDEAVQAGAEQLYEKYMNKTMKHKTNEQIRQEKGMTVGLANLPFGSKLFASKKQDAIFSKKIIDAETASRIGDKTIAPHWLNVKNQLRTTKLSQALSNDSKMFTESLNNINAVLTKISVSDKIGKNATDFVEGSSNIYKTASKIDALTVNEKEALFDLIDKGEYDNFIKYYEAKVDIYNQIASNPNAYKKEILLQVKEKQAECRKQINNLLGLRAELINSRKFANDIATSLSSDQYHGAINIQKMNSANPYENSEIVDKLVKSISKEPVVKKPSDKMELDPIFEEINTDITKYGEHKRNKQKVSKAKEAVEGANLELLSKQIEEATANKDWAEVSRLEKKALEIYKNPAFDEYLSIDSGAVSDKEKLRRKKEQQFIEAGTSFQTKEGAEKDFFENLDEGEAVAKGKNYRDYNPDLDDRIAQETGEVTARKLTPEEAKEYKFEWNGISDDVVTEEEGNSFREAFKKIIGDDATLNTAKYNAETGQYELQELKHIADNFDDRIVYGLRSLMSSGMEQEARDLIKTVLANSDNASSAKFINDEVASSKVAMDLVGKSRVVGIEKLNFTSPSFMRMDSVNIEAKGVGDAIETFTHTRPLYGNSWKDLKRVITGPDGKINLQGIAPNGKTHEENLRSMSRQMTKTDRGFAGEKVFFSDGSISSYLPIYDEKFIEEHLDELIKLDDEVSNIRRKNYKITTGKDLEATEIKGNQSHQASVGRQTFNSEKQVWEDESNMPEYVNSKITDTQGASYDPVNGKPDLTEYYGKEVSTWLNVNSDNIMSEAERYAKVLEVEMEDLIAKSFEVVNGSQEHKKLIGRINDMKYDIDTVRNAETLQDLSNTRFLNGFVGLAEKFEKESTFGVCGPVVDLLFPSLKNKSVNERLMAFCDEFGITLSKEPTDVKSKMFHTFDNGFNNNSYDDYNYILEILGESVKEIDDSGKIERVLEQLRKTYGDGVVAVRSEDGYRFEMPMQSDNYEFIGNTKVYNKRDVRQHNLDVAFRLNVEGNDLLAKERTNGTTKVRKDLNKLGYTKDETFSAINGVSLDDKKKLVSLIENKVKENLYTTFKNIPFEMREKWFTNLPEEARNVITDYDFKDYIFGGHKFSYLDQSTINVYEEKLNKMITDLQEFVDLDSVRPADYVDGLAYDKVKTSFGKFSDVENFLMKEDGDKSYERVIEAINGMKVDTKEMANKLRSVGDSKGALEVLEMMPRIRTKEADDYIKKLSKDDSFSIVKDLKNLNVEEANKVMKERTGIEEWFSTDVAGSYTSMLHSKGKTIASRQAQQTILGNFAVKHDGQALKEGESIIVKRGALKHFADVCGVEDLSKYNIDLDEGMFVKVDKNDLHKMQLENSPKFGDKPTIGTYIMKDADIDNFNQFAKYQEDETKNAFLKAFDNFLGKYKIINTVPNPGFHINNAIGNAFNSFLALGSAVINPEKISIARTIVKNPDPKQFIMIGDTKYTYKQVNEMLTKAGVLERTFTESELVKEGADATTHFTDLPIIKQGLHISNDIEQTQRATLFIEALRDGKSLEEAKETVSRFLFDYSDLTNEEKKVMKRAFPFYTFARKNIPLQLSEIFNQPHIYRNLEKFLNNFEQLSGVDYVPDEDRNEWRKEHIQMPFKVGGKPFGIDPNLPSQQLNRLEPNKVLGQMNPLIKMPLEIISGENLYTGMPIGGMSEYLPSQISEIRALQTTTKKKGVNKALYPLGYLSGMPMSTIGE